MGSPRHLYIAVIGPVCSGKTSFINLISGSRLEESDGVGPCTESIQISKPFDIRGYTVTLIDTPGFGNGLGEQMTILKQLESYIETQHEQHVTLHGILYFYSITDNTTGGLAKRNLDIFKKLVGEDTLRNVIVVTTMWDCVSKEVGNARIAEMGAQERLFKPALDNGAISVPYDRSTEGAQLLIRMILMNRNQKASVDALEGPQDTSRPGLIQHQNRQKCTEEFLAAKREMEDNLAMCEQIMKEDLRRYTYQLQAELTRNQNAIKSVYQSQVAEIEGRYGKQVLAASKGLANLDTIPESIAYTHKPQVYIAVMGPTGCGKSSFINLISGSNLAVSNKLGSCTGAVQASDQFELDGRLVTLIDTPGFDDSTRSQMSILKDIASHLELQHKQDIKLHGILYFHKIVDNRMGGVARQTFHMFKKLVGEKAFKNVIVVTTMWDKVTEEEGSDRLQQLSTGQDLFKPVLDKGAQMMRHYRTIESAQLVISEILNNYPLSLEIQDELARGKQLFDTAAGQHVNAEVTELVNKHRQAMENLKQEMETAIAKQDGEAKRKLEAERKRIQAMTEATINEQRNMQQNYDKHKEEMAKVYKQVSDLQAQLRQQKESLQAEVSRMQAGKSSADADRRAAESRIRDLERQIAQKSSGGGCVIF